MATTVTGRFSGTPAGTHVGRMPHRLLLSGDAQSGTDALALSGDATDGDDVVLLSGDMAVAVSSTSTDRLPSFPS